MSTRSTNAPFAAPQKVINDNHDIFQNSSNYCMSRKLNGYRVLIDLKERKITTRKGTSMAHLVDIIPLLKLVNIFDCLEGEMIAETQNDDENPINPIDLLAQVAQRIEYQPPENVKVCVGIFDCKLKDQPKASFLERYKVMYQHLCKINEHFKLIIQYKWEATDRKNAYSKYTPLLLPNDEGIVVRSLKASYDQPNMFKLLLNNGKQHAKVVAKSFDEQTKHIKDANNQLYYVPQKLQKLVFETNFINSLPCEIVVNTKQNFVVNLGTNCF